MTTETLLIAAVTLALGLVLGWLVNAARDMRRVSCRDAARVDDLAYRVDRLERREYMRRGRETASPHVPSYLDGLVAGWPNVQAVDTEDKWVDNGD